MSGTFLFWDEKCIVCVRACRVWQLKMVMSHFGADLKFLNDIFLKVAAVVEHGGSRTFKMRSRGVIPDFFFG